MVVRKLVLVLLALLLSSVLAQSYEWRDVRQRVEILPNGDVIVEDERTLWTNEDFGEAFIQIELAPGQRIELLEGSGAVSPGPDARAFVQNIPGGQELVVRNERRVSERRVRFRYRLTGAVDIYSDVVQWYWQILEQKEHPPVIGYQLEVLAPGPMAEPYNAFLHRYRNPEVPKVNLSADRSRLSVKFRRIPNRNGVEIRYFMDPQLFTVKSNQAGLENLLRDEARIAGVLDDIAAQERLRRNPLWGLLGLGIVILLALGIWRAYRRYGREPDIGPVMKYPFEPPSDQPPAAVTLLSSQHSPNVQHAFHATVMDLARRGFGNFDSSGKKFNMQLNLEKDDSDLLGFERDVLSYLKKAASSRGLFGQSKEPDYLDFKELKRYSEKNLSKFLPRWQKSAKSWLEQKLGGPLLAKESQRAAASWAGLAVLGSLVNGLGIFLAAGSAQIAFIATSVLSFLLIFIAAFSLPAWRREIAPEIYGWQGFKRTLSDYSRMKDAPDDFFVLWDRYYVYAAALGVAEKFLRNLRRAAPLRNLDERSLVRQASWLGSSSLSSSDFNSFSQAISSLSSALSSASASSGGSVSGGGGGGGGGSSGGR